MKQEHIKITLAPSQVFSTSINHFNMSTQYKIQQMIQQSDADARNINYESDQPEYLGSTILLSRIYIMQQEVLQSQLPAICNPNDSLIVGNKWIRLHHSAHPTSDSKWLQVQNVDIKLVHSHEESGFSHQQTSQGVSHVARCQMRGDQYRL